MKAIYSEVPLNFLKKNAMGLGKEVRPLFTAETAKSKAYRKQER